MTSSSAAQRSDGFRNRQRLLGAAGELLARGEDFSLAEVAEAAQLSNATAYRHFRSAADVTDAYVGGFWDAVEARADSVAAENFYGFSVVWVESVLEWGPAVAYLRSRQGFLARRAAGDERVGRLTALAEPRIEAELRRPSREELSYVLAVWNALADPREVLDQHETLGWSAPRITRNLYSAVRAVISR